MKLLVTTAVILAMSTSAFAQSAATSGAPADRAQVERAQRALKDAGHDPGAIDGVAGAQTRAALEAYQRQHGLNASGRLDDATLAKLGAGEASASTAQTGGDEKASQADPAQATKTGANAGEGASYSRSNDKK